jgi:23S rRNA pseudouridine955/2504/2580 synthase
MSPIHPSHDGGDSPGQDSGGQRGVEHWVVPDDHAGQRIDNFLLARLRGVPKTRIYRMLRTGEVRVNGARASSDYRLQAEDRLRIPPVRMSAAIPPGLPAPGQGSPAPLLARSIAASIVPVHDDEDVLAVSKPPGLAVHGGSGVRLGLIEALRQSREPVQMAAPGSVPPFLELVHRLDRETSGLILLARRRSALTELHRQLREGRMRKQYLAMVWGGPDAVQTVIDAPLHKWVNAQGERWVRVQEGGQAAITRVRRIGHAVHPSLGAVSLLLCEPVTGRTHQLRVHLASRGYPIIGDPKYGDRDRDAHWRSESVSTHVGGKRHDSRMFLHAWRLRLNHPRQGTPLSLEAQPDAAFLAGLSQFGLHLP